VNYTDFNSFFDKQKADISILSTYDFDPLYFEHRLLRSVALKEARRIIIFMDRGRYLEILKNEDHSRYVNLRYLLVPIAKPGGVFHPKLSLLLSQDGAWVLCGSNNLTQAGCTHNLELLNATRISVEKDKPLTANASLVMDSILFYSLCLELGSGPEHKIARQWLGEISNDIPWLSMPVNRSLNDSDPKLVHTLSFNLWEWIQERLGKRSPSKIMIISPFYDPDLRLLERFREKWPKSEVEIIVQQQTSNLPVNELKKIGGKNYLFCIEGGGGRRLHAKAFCFYVDDVAICLTGSANFTSAAIDGVNVEACLGLEMSIGRVNELFDKGLRKMPVDIDDFEPGRENEPAPNGVGSGLIILSSAALDPVGKLHLRYRIKRNTSVESLSVAIHAYGEEKPNQTIPLPLRFDYEFVTPLDDKVVSGFRGATRCYLLGIINGKREVSLPYWLIQETRLTHEASDGSRKTNKETHIRETGQGLTDYLNHLMAAEGPQAVIEYLKHLNIRYHDDSRLLKKGALIPRIYDPTRPDGKPNWVLELPEKEDLEKTIYDFVDRHQKNVLYRHAKKGNINGLSNFLDVFIEINKLLFSYYRLGILKPLWAMQKINRNISIFTQGDEDINWVSVGFIAKMLDLHRGDRGALQDTLTEANVPGHLRAALLLSQMLRWEDDSKKKGGPGQYLGRWLEKIEACLSPLGLHNVKTDQVVAALDVYHILNDLEKTHWLSFL